MSIVKLIRTEYFNIKYVNINVACQLVYKHKSTLKKRFYFCNFTMIGFLMSSVELKSVSFSSTLSWQDSVHFAGLLSPLCLSHFYRCCFCLVFRPSVVLWRLVLVKFTLLYHTSSPILPFPIACYVGVRCGPCTDRIPVWNGYKYRVEVFSLISSHCHDFSAGWKIAAWWGIRC